MTWRWRRVAYALAVSLIPALGACAIVDQFSGRAVNYNLEAEQAQEQALLLNIIRASLRRPMQFTSLQSITGTASASGTVGGGYGNTHQTPFIAQFPGAGPLANNTNSAISRIVTGTGTVSGTMSGGPTFVVPVLDTQEFYQGILAPIPLQVVDYYLQQGFPPELLFDLFVQKIEVTRLDDGTCNRFTFLNSVRDDLQFGQFEAFADYLLGSGLTAERVNASVAFGPPIPKLAEGASPADTAKILEAYSQAANAGLEIRQEGTGPNAAYRVQKRNNSLRFCFANPGASLSWIGRPGSLVFCGNFNRRLPENTDASAAQAPRCVPRRLAAPKGQGGNEGFSETYENRNQGLHSEGVSEFSGIRLAPEFLERIDRFQNMARTSNTFANEVFFDTAAFRNATVSFIVYTRSTEGILYYLGEITRRRLFTETSLGQPARYTQVKTGLHYGTIPMSECDDRENGGVAETKSDLQALGRRRLPSSALRYSCENIFVVDADDELASGDHLLATSYDGRTFALPRDPRRAGRTLQVLELVKQLLALNTSAKQLPATSVISIQQP